jgi:hypothetical protein
MTIKQSYNHVLMAFHSFTSKEYLQIIDFSREKTILFDKRSNRLIMIWFKLINKE